MRRSARAPSSSGATTHHPPRTPQQRLLALGTRRDTQQKAQEDLQRSSDPIALLVETVRRCQASLASLSAGQDHQEQGPRTGAEDPEQAGKEQRTHSRFLRNLQLLWRESQPLPEPRQKRLYTPAADAVSGAPGTDRAVARKGGHHDRRRDPQEADQAGSRHPPRGSAALDGAARQGMAYSPSRAIAGVDAISKKGCADRGRAQSCRDNNWR